MMAGRVGDYLKVIRCSKGGYSDVPFTIRPLHMFYVPHPVHVFPDII
jgi:hypothetical protein